VLRTAAVMAAGEPQITQAHLSDDFLEDVRRLAQQQTAAAQAAAAPSMVPAAGAAMTNEAMPPASAGTAEAAFVAPQQAASPPEVPDGVAAALLPCSGTMHEHEILLIETALAAAGGNISEASKRLGISRNTIYRKLRWNRPAREMDLH
jgi:transcriptional regulator of acetoin/glycerol metabolism